MGAFGVCFPVACAAEEAVGWVRTAAEQGHAHRMAAARNIKLDYIEVSSSWRWDDTAAASAPTARPVIDCKTGASSASQTSSLERYYRAFKLSDLPVYSRDDLVPLVGQHLSELVSKSYWQRVD